MNDITVDMLDLSWHKSGTKILSSGKKYTNILEIYEQKAELVDMLDVAYKKTEKILNALFEDFMEYKVKMVKGEVPMLNTGQIRQKYPFVYTKVAYLMVHVNGTEELIYNIRNWLNDHKFGHYMDENMFMWQRNFSNKKTYHGWYCVDVSRVHDNVKRCKHLSNKELKEKLGLTTISNQA